MGVRRFRSVEEMPGPQPRPPLDPENIRILFGLMSFTHRLAGFRHEPGVRRYRSWDEALTSRTQREQAEAAKRR